MAREVSSFDIDNRAGRLSAKVNFQDRHPSIAQTLLSGVIWVGTLTLACTLIWSITAGNVKLRPFGDCSPCPEGFYGIGADGSRMTCATMCVANDLEAQIEQKCAKPAWHEFNAAATRPLTLWTQTLVERAHKSTGDPAFETSHVRMLSQAEIRAAAFAQVGDPAQLNKSMMQLLASPVILPTLLPLLLVVSCLWFALLKAHPHCAMWTTIAVFLIALCYAYYLTRNYMMLVIAGAFAGWMGVTQKQINQGCDCLQGGLKALSESPKSLIVICVSCLIMLVYTAMLVGLLVFTSQIIHVHVGEDGQCQLLPLSGYFSQGFTILFLLTSSFFNMAVCYSISFAIGCWYFHQEDPAAPETPIVKGLQMALFSRNGTGVCTQAACVITLVDYMETKVKNSKLKCCDPLWCLFTALWCAFHQCLESVCHFALVSVAIEGGGFCATSKLAKDTIGIQRAARFLVVDSSLNWLLHLQAHALATAFGMVALAVVDAAENLGIFSAIINQAGDVAEESTWYSQWIIVAVIIPFFYLMRRPLTTMVVVILIYAYFGAAITYTLANAILAALLIGSVGSLALHQFVEAASGALTGMLYCWSLDEAIGGDAPNPRRERVSQLMAKASELQPSAPPMASLPQQMMTVQCPAGMVSGMAFQVQLPNGQLATVNVPPGVQPGQAFQVAV